MVPAHIQLVRLLIRKMLKRLRHPPEIMLMCVRWYATYLSSLRDLDEMMAERGEAIDHAGLLQA
jgi:putative transposase